MDDRKRQALDVGKAGRACMEVKKPSVHERKMFGYSSRLGGGGKVKDKGVGREPYACRGRREKSCVDVRRVTRGN